MSLVNALTIVTTLKFSVGALALFKLVLTITVIMSSTVIIMRGSSQLLRAKRCSPHRTIAGTVKRVANPVINMMLMLLTMFVPAALVDNVSKRLCGRFTLAVTTSAMLDNFGSLALAPTLYTLFLRGDGPSAFFVCGKFGGTCSGARKTCSHVIG